MDSARWLRIVSLPVSVLALAAAPRRASAWELPEVDLGALFEPLFDRLLSLSLSDVPGLDDFGDLGERFGVYLAGKPWRISERKIDRMVGEPRDLEPTTAASLDSLGPMVWMELGSSFAHRLDAFEADWGVAPPDALPGPVRGPSFGLDEETAALAMGGALDRMQGYFRADELVDLGVFTLSEVTTLPSTPTQWRAVRRAISGSDTWIALGSVLALAAEDQGFVSASGWLVRAGGDRVRFGWYGGARDLGFAWHPRWRAGMKVASPGLDVSAGVLQNVDATGPTEGLALEVGAREHLLSMVGRSRGWDVAASAGGRFVLEHAEAAEEGRILGEARLFGRRRDFLPHYDLLLDGAYRRELGEPDVYQASLGFSHPSSGLIGVFSVAGEATDADDTVRFGVLVAGPLDGGRDRRGELLRARARLSASLGELEALEERLCRDRAPGETEEAARRGAIVPQLESAYAELDASLDGYLVARGRAGPAPADEGELAYARTRLSAWPALAVVCWPRG